MPWSNQSGGGGWKGGSGGPWGPRPGGPDNSPILRKFCAGARTASARPCRAGGMGGPLRGVVRLSVPSPSIGFFGFTAQVNPEELGVVLRFGNFVRLLPPGLNFRWPYPIEVVELPKITASIASRSACAARPTAARLPTARDKESLMLTGDENIVDVDFVVFWRIKDAPNFLFNIEDPEGTVRMSPKAPCARSSARATSNLSSPRRAPRPRPTVQALMQKTLDSYGAGVQVTQVQLQKVDPPAEVIDAFRDVQAARADQERLQNEAQAYANRIVPEAKGEAERILQAAARLSRPGRGRGQG